MKTLTIEKCDEGHVQIFGDTYNYRELFKKLCGTWNPYLKCWEFKHYENPDLLQQHVQMGLEDMDEDFISN